MEANARRDRDRLPRRTGAAPAATGWTDCADDGDAFDLAKFVVGSEGTLVIATEAVVDLVPKPRHTVVRGRALHVRAQAAIEATEDALTCDPAPVEMIDRTILDLSRQKIEYAELGASLEGDPEALLFVSFTGDDRDASWPAGWTASVELWARTGTATTPCARVTPPSRATCSRCARPASGC